MKNLILLTCLLFSVCVFAQETTVEKSLEEIQISPPEFTGIENVVSLLQEEKPDLISHYLTKNVKYPKSAVQQGKEGTEVVQFNITPTGELSNFKVINSVCPEIDDELISVLKSTNGMWIPGSNNGNAVAMEKEVSMVFNLGETDNISIKEKFTAKAIAYFSKGTQKLFYENKPKKALKHFDMAIRYLPNDESLLFSRGMVKYELEDKAGAKRDWDRMNHLAEKGTIDKYIELTADNYKQLKGFEEFSNYTGK